MVKLFCVLILAIPFTSFAQKKPVIVYSKDSDLVKASSILQQSYQPYLFSKPRPFTFLTRVPGDLFEIIRSPFQKGSLQTMGIIAGSTALLLPFDQTLMNRIGHTSERIGLEPEVEYDKVFRIGYKTMFKWPDNLNSAFYQLGEGTTTMEIAGLFFIYGKIEQDNRASQTASDLIESYLSMGITVQTLKRITGRQAPFKATIPGGRWQPFPPFLKYQHYTTNYDAFPSGHLATMMATVTVLAENYPEKKWIRPIGYLLTGLTGWSMMNNKVHWASDFPLGLGIGYLAGKISYRQHHKKEQATKETLL
jgi:membrane-associated phospholipid phosphatase